MIIEKFHFSFDYFIFLTKLQINYTNLTLNFLMFANKTFYLRWKIER